MDVQNRRKSGGFKYEDPEKCVSSLLSDQGRGKLGRNMLAGVIQCLETNAQSLIGDLNGLMKLGVEERFQL